MKKLRSIHDTLPDRDKMVQIGGYFIGKMRYYKGEYNHNDLWIENHQGEGCAVPLPDIEKAVSDSFLKHF